jgi:ELWxxDGT repeat protein
MSNLFSILPALNQGIMRKLNFCLAFLFFSILSSAQTTILKSGGSSSFGGVGLGNRVVYANFSTGQIGGTDGTVAGTIDIPTVTLSSGNTVAGITGKIVFAGTTVATGNEIWASDGTLAGTIQLMDINPGPGNSDPQGGTNGLIPVNNTVYFSATDGVSRKLYKTDGTVLGTALVKDLGSVTLGFPYTLNPVGSTLLFTVNGKQLWKSDGTSGGTVMVKDFSPGAATTFSNYFIGNGTYTFFAANDGTNGMELWRTDGTGAGTIMLANLGAGAADGLSLFGGEPDWNAYMFNNTVYFQPNISGAKLYKSDGSLAGTSLVTDLNPGGGGMSLNNALSIGTSFYFNALSGLYKSDGTAAGTALVKAIGTGAVNMLRPQDNLGSNVLSGTFGGGRFFMIADDGSNGKELWVTDGTTAGTNMVKNINPGSAGAFTGTNDNYFYTKYRFYFGANDGTNGIELWESDGTTIGTNMVQNINTGAASSSPDFFGVSLSSSKMVFTATDATGNNIYVLNSTVVPFPLSLLDFTAKLRGSEIALDWITENEVNVSHFNVQRSVTGESFLNVGKIASTGTSARNSYSYTDKAPAKTGHLYYRLEMVDKDGKTSYSKIRDIKIKPNLDFALTPVKGETILNLGDISGMVTITISDANGRVHIQQKQNVNAGGSVRLSTASLATGMYFVTVEYNGSVQTKRFIR